MNSRRAFECALAVLCLGTAASAALPPQVVLQRTYARDKAGPDSFTDSFTACDPAGQFTIAVDNAGVSSAAVSVNGVEVVHQSDFNQKVAHVARALGPMQAANTVAARL